MSTSIAHISWDFVPGSTGTLVEYKLSSSSVWIQPTSPNNPVTTTNTYPITINDNTRYDVRLTTLSNSCSPKSRTFQIINPINNCCPPGYVLSTDQTYCSQTNDTSATPPSSPENTVAVSNHAYSTCGSYIYDSGYNLDGTGISNQIPLSNAFWKNGGTCADNNTTDGPLNRSGLWATTTTDNQDIGFTVCVSIDTPSTYYIAIGCDNLGIIRIDGTEIVHQDPTALGIQYGVGPAATFKVWHIYPVVLNVGDHVLEVIGHNIDSVAGLGAEIYNNTAAGIVSATSYADLNLVFSTKDFVGQPVQVGSGGIGYTCPDGYSLVLCEGPAFCRQILTTSTIPC